MKTILTRKNSFIARKNLNNKIGLGLSIAILSLVVLAIIAIYGDTHTYGHTIDPTTKQYIPVPMFSSLDISLLGYFSVINNILVACIAIANIVEFVLIRKNKLQRIHLMLHMFNLCGAVNLTFNFAFTLLYLLPMCCTTNAYCYEYLFTGSLLIFNVAVPILSILLFVFCFKDNSLRSAWWSLIGMIPTAMFFFVYMVGVLAHSYPTTTNVEWDIYGFGVTNKYLLVLALFIIMLVTAAICIGLWKLNKKSNWNRSMVIAVVNIIIAAQIIAFSGVMFKTNLCNDRFIENLGAAETFFLRFVYFTHLSNWWVCATSIIYVVYSIRIYKGLTDEIPIWAQIMRLAGVAAISITLLMQFAVAAGWMFDKSVDWHTALTEAYIKCFRKHLLFEHFITPFVAIASFIVLEHTDLKWKHILHSATPMAIYALCYVIVLYATVNIPLRQLTPGHERWVSPWDVYEISKMFGSVGKYVYWIFPPLIYVLMLAINWIFWYFNRKIHFNKPKKGSAIAELKKDWAEFKKFKLFRKSAKTKTK